MVNVRPFRALHYDHVKAGDLAAVIAPPYDVIDEAERDRLYERSPHNVVRLILNRSIDRYGEAAANLLDWRRKGVIVRDPEPCLYFYVQDFVLPDGTEKRRSGFMAAVRLEPFASGNIRPHERTFRKAREDRLKLTTACRTNLSPIFGILAGHGEVLRTAHGAIDGTGAWIDVRDESGGRHRVWRLVQGPVTDGIRDALAAATILIADGHHRYETALAYRDLRRVEGDTDPEAPHNFVLMYLTSMEDPGLVILPTHRLLRSEAAEFSGPAWAALKESFEVEEFASTGEGEAELLARLREEKGRASFGLRIGRTNRCSLLRLRSADLLERALAEIHPAVRRLDVTVLDALILRGLLGIDCGRATEQGLLTYTHDDAEVLAAARAGATAFLMRSPRMEEVESVCMAGQLMPEKSTYFFPKLKSGLVFHSLDADE